MVADWVKKHPLLADGSPAGLGPLNFLLETEKAQETEDGLSIIVPHNALASLEAWELKRLDLPCIAPFRLTIERSDSLSSPNFSIFHGFTRSDGLPLIGARRNGAFLEHAGNKYIIPSPLFDALELIEDFKNNPPRDMDKRFLWWAKVKELLPEETTMDDYLKSINIVKAECFSLDFNEEKGLTIMPRLLLRKNDVAVLGTKDVQDNESEAKDLLPPEIQRQFGEFFLRRTSSKCRYGLSGGWFVVVPPALQKALEVVHSIKDEPLEIKRAFVNNPRAILKEKLEEELEDDIFESIFVETPLFLSERIKYLGEWHPKAGLFIKTKGENWLPEDKYAEVVGFSIAGNVYQIESGDIPELEKKLLEAKEQNIDRIEYNSQSFPVTDEAINTVKRASGHIQLGPDEQIITIKVDDITCDVLKQDLKKIYEDLRQAESQSKPDITYNDKKILVNEETITAFQQAISQHLDVEGKTTPQKPYKPIIYDNIEYIESSTSSLDNTKKRAISTIMPETNPQISLQAHQFDGFQWLQHHWEYCSPGALLADDMGLGKTLQTLFFLRWVKIQMQSGLAKPRPFLIVAPTGLLKVWEEEEQKHLAPPGLGELLEAHGKRFNAMIKRSHLDVEKELKNADWVLTTYETMRDKIKYFMNLHWAVVVFDEAQKIKNPRALVTDMAKSLKAEFILAVTGTPVENRLHDLWCIIDTVHYKRLNSLKKFVDEYAPSEKIEYDRLKKLKSDLMEPEDSAIILRRTKDIWKERPKKEEISQQGEMPPAQARAYEEVVQNVRSAPMNQYTMLKVLHSLRSISLHPYLNPEYVDDEKYINDSARLTATFEFLDEIYTKKEKALIFLEYLSMQATLSELIQNRYGLSKVMIINGKVTGSKRIEKVNTFQEGSQSFDVMILSPKAGGVGITLTAANHVIHLTRWWNPAVEDQCTDRAYRIGQSRPVTVYYPIAIHPKYGAEHSFDVKLNNLLEQKRSLSKTLLAPTEGNKDDLKYLYNSTILTRKRCPLRE